MRGSVFARTGRTASFVPSPRSHPSLPQTNHALPFFSFARSLKCYREAFLLPGSPYWFAPIRRKLLQYVGVPENDLAPGHRHTDVVTYVSRQSWGRRMLKEEDHEELVRVMTQAAMEDGFEFNVVESESIRVGLR